MSENLIEYVGVIAGGFVVFLFQRFWIMSSRLSVLETKQNMKQEALTKLEKSFEIMAQDITSIKITLESLKR